MSFILSLVRADPLFWDNLVEKYSAQLIAEGWQGPLESDRLSIIHNSATLDIVLSEALDKDGEKGEFLVTEGGGEPRSDGRMTKFLGKFFVTGSYITIGPYDCYEEALSAAKREGLL